MFKHGELPLDQDLHLRKLGVKTFEDLMQLADRVERRRDTITHIAPSCLVAKGAHYIELDTKVTAHRVIPGVCPICAAIVDSLGVSRRLS